MHASSTRYIQAKAPVGLFKRLGILSVELDRSMNDLLLEALTDLLVKHASHPSPVADGPDVPGVTP
jgi:hypothetical protein